MVTYCLENRKPKLDKMHAGCHGFWPSIVPTPNIRQTNKQTNKQTSKQTNQQKIGKPGREALDVAEVYHAESCLLRQSRVLPIFFFIKYYYYY
jgi:hypothetical protein